MGSPARAADSVEGVIAGDDTIFIATPDERAARALARRIAPALGRGGASVGA